MSKVKKAFIATYVVFLLMSFLFIRSVISEDNIDVEDRDNKKVVEIKPISVNLVVDNLGERTPYRARLKNDDTIDDLLDLLRDDHGFYYERVEYISRTELNHINNQEAPEGYHWRIFMDETDVTNKLAKTILTDESTYILKLVKL